MRQCPLCAEQIQDGAVRCRFCGSDFTWGTSVRAQSLGRYRILGILGQGAMGTVYRAHDPSLDREVAIKEPAFSGGSTLGSQGERDRFFTEARAAARLSHPNIVQVHEVVEAEGQVFLVMELLEGRTFDEVLSQRGSLSPDEAAYVLHEVAEALAAAHAAGVIHRDIKPENCWWLSDGRVKVADFGLARLGSQSSKTQAGTVLGTPGYMSPEQVRGLHASPASDVFSCGVMGYELLTGAPPFGVGDATSVMYRIVHEEPQDLGAVCPAAPPALVSVIMQALSKDPEERFADGFVLSAALAHSETDPFGTTDTRLLAGSTPETGLLPEPGSPSPQPMAQTARSAARHVRSGKLIAIVGGIAAAVVVAVVGAVMIAGGSSPIAPGVTSSAGSAPSTDSVPGISQAPIQSSGTGEALLDGRWDSVTEEAIEVTGWKTPEVGTVTFRPWTLDQPCPSCTATAASTMWGEDVEVPLQREGRAYSGTARLPLTHCADESIQNTVSVNIWPSDVETGSDGQPRVTQWSGSITVDTPACNSSSGAYVSYRLSTSG